MSQRTDITIAKENLESMFQTAQKKLLSGGMSIRIESGDGSFTWEQSSGDLSGDKQYMIASVTKLFATVILLNLVKEGRLSFEDPISKYLPKDIMEGLHIYKGVDYSDRLTVQMLMTQTGGLPDYYTEKGKDGVSGESALKIDRYMSLEERISRNKALKTKYIPGTGKKSFYSDMNWDLFQPIIEKITNQSIAQCYEQYIFSKISMKNTYLYLEGMEYNFPGIFIKDGIYKIPQSLKEWPLSGAVISTNEDMNIFLKAFFGGKLFPLELFKKYNSYKYTQFFPMEYGLGNVRFRYPGVPDLYGHSGATGVVCYYAPECDMYISACINELNETKVTQMLAKYGHYIKKHTGKMNLNKMPYNI